MALYLEFGYFCAIFLLHFSPLPMNTIKTNSAPSSPYYYIRKRFFKNKPAVFGLVVVLLSVWVAMSGHLIMPDPTPKANQGAAEIRKQPPFFNVTLLKFRKHLAIEETSFIESIYLGEESHYTITPIKEYGIEDDTLYFTPYGRERRALGLPLVEAVEPLLVGKSTQHTLGSQRNYMRKGDSIFFIDVSDRLQKTTLAEVRQKFEEQQVSQVTYWLGTDRSGRDMLSRLLYGTRVSLLIGGLAVLISLLVGIALGAASGFFGGWVDALISWFMTVIWSIPSIMLVIAIAITLGSKGIWVIFVAVGLTTWVDVARVVRGQVLAIKEKPFVEAARAFGLGNFRIILRHILPNMLGAIIVTASTNFASAILIEAGLSFLGLGVEPDTPSWGMMVHEGYNAIGTSNSWHLIILPSFCIAILVLAFNLLGNGIEQAFNPKGSSYDGK
ncbi:ABC transporter permease [Hugenholtzia roseola]|uniref:ABC transporter permease n=1 Tax=Hugenholtzia roseola TaxID=1002 RepID=UPI001FDF3430|nr:ABC transporter permease [Hugenholtzia roseola]